MSLIPFILDLADELHEFNRCLATGGMDVDDFGFGIYPHELQPQQPSQHPLLQQQSQQQHLQPQRRPRALSQFYWVPNINKSRHHPYYRAKPCCNKSPTQLVHDHQLEKESSSSAGGGGGVVGAGTAGGTPVSDKETATNSSSANTSSPNTLSATTAGKSAYSVVNKNGFQVSMNVKQFAPNELTVKTIDNCIVVEGQHEDKEDGHGVISRHFIRKYMLPKGYDPNEVLSTLSSDGILTVKAPPPALKTDEPTERIVDIQQTGGPAQVQPTAAKEANGKGDQAKMSAASGAETVAPVIAGTTSAAITTQQTQLQQQQQQKQKQQPQQLEPTVESIQQQQTKQPIQPLLKNSQPTRERNGNPEHNELPAEQETEPRTAEPTAEPTATSSSTSIATNNNTSEITNINSNNSNTESSVASNVAAISTVNSNTIEKEEANMMEEEEREVQVNTMSTKMLLASNVPAKPAIDAIMTAVTADEPMETEDEGECVKEQIDEQTTADVKDANANVSIMNAVTKSATAPNTNTKVNIATNDSNSVAENNSIEITTSNNIDAELPGPNVTEVRGSTPVTNNGVAEPEPATIADGSAISMETAVAEIEASADGTTAVDANITDVADVDADGMDGAGIAIGIGIGVDVDVNVGVIGSGGGSDAGVEGGNDGSGTVENVVVPVQPPSAADLVAAADAAILLAKTQCEPNGEAGGVAGNKTAITTEEITN